jgi:hypothetical protein
MKVRGRNELRMAGNALLVDLNKTLEVWYLSNLQRVTVFTALYYKLKQK